MRKKPKIKEIVEDGDVGYEIETDIFVCDCAQSEFELEEMMRRIEIEEREAENEY
jgi:hypothetical protein